MISLFLDTSSKTLVVYIVKDNEIIYIGKAADLKFRIACHVHLSKKCYEEISRIEYTSFDNEYEMDLAERYFIPKINKKNKNILLYSQS